MSETPLPEEMTIDRRIASFSDEKGAVGVAHETGEPIVSIAGLGKRYASGFQALKNIELSIRRGEIFALLGPNGAGKTTLINIVCGIVNASAGRVTVDGHDIVADYRAARAEIGLVPQELTTDAFTSVWGTASFSRGLFGKPRNDAHIAGVLKSLSLWDKKDSPVIRLSGGMKRRVMIAKALAHEPRILFLDEPTAGVDVELRRQLWNYVLELNRRGVTIVLTTHYLEEAQELCDQIAIINRGEVVACEPTTTLLSRMDTRKVLVTPAEPVEAAPKLPGFETHLLPAGGFAVSYRTGQSSVEQVLAAIRKKGLHIKDISTEDPDLEDVFVSLTYAAEGARA